MMMKILVKVWGMFPIWLQTLISRFIRPRFRVAVAAFVFDEDKRILLCEHTYRKSHPWGLPAGSLEYGEEPEDEIKRELWEETGFNVQVERILYADSAVEFHHISLIYLCKIIDGAFKPNLVSTIVRNVLMNTFDLVEGVVMDSTELARAARRRPQTPAEDTPGEFGPAAPRSATAVVAWQQAALNLNAVCEQCNAILSKGQLAAIGIPIPARPVFLCLDCLAGLGAPGTPTSSRE